MYRFLKEKPTMIQANIIDERDNRLVSDRPTANDTKVNVDTSMKEKEDLDVESKTSKELIQDLEVLNDLSDDLKEKQKEMKKRIAKRQKFLHDLRMEQSGEYQDITTHIEMRNMHTGQSSPHPDLTTYREIRDKQRSN